PHHGRQVEEVPRMDRRPRRVVPDGVEDLLVPLPRDRLRGYRPLAAVADRDAVGEAVAALADVVGGVDREAHAAYDRRRGGTEDRAGRLGGALTGERRRDVSLPPAARGGDALRPGDRGRDPAAGVGLEAGPESLRRRDLATLEAVHLAAVEG